jgi:hypothetical protein
VDNQRSGIPIRIPSEGSYVSAILRYGPKGPTLETESKKEIPAPSHRTSFVIKQIIVNEAGRTEIEAIKPMPEIILEPILRVEGGYAEEHIHPEPYYPPSTNGWAGRVSDDYAKAVFFVHESVETSKYWLSIVDPKSNRIFEAHLILPFEAGILIYREEFDNYSAAIRQLSVNDRTWAAQWIKEILDGPPPTWQELAKITKDVYIPNLQLGETMRATLEKIIPASFGSVIREQIMAFIGLITRWTYPNEDPIPYFKKIESVPVLRVLLMGHLWCLVGDSAPPPYIRILLDSESYRLGAPALTTRESAQKNSWIRAHWQINERLPRFSNTSRKHATQLNASKKIITSLPVSKSEAARSRKKWIERFRLQTEGLLLRSNIRPRSLGLIRVASLTAAHQWPHKHMRYSTSVGTGGYRDPHIQIMEMPKSSYEAVLRARPSIVSIDWSAFRVNSHLFNEKTQSWRSAPSRILKALDGKRSIRRLGNEFGAWKGTQIFRPKKEWAQALDATANLSYLATFEYEGYLDQFGLTPKSLSESLEDLRDRGIIDIAYLPNLTDLLSIVILAQGDSNATCSLARSLLKYAPSATSMLGKNGEWLLALCRMPAPEAHQLMATLPDAAVNRNVTLRCNRTLSLRSYTWDFYQRLLRSDGSWEDDVSAMLSQIRIPFREESPED